MARYEMDNLGLLIRGSLVQVQQGEQKGQQQCWPFLFVVFEPQ